MTEIDDTNDISLTASDDFAGNIYESATVKAFRGFTNVPAETIRKIRFVYCQMRFGIVHIK